VKAKDDMVTEKPEGLIEKTCETAVWRENRDEMPPQHMYGESRGKYRLPFPALLRAARTPGVKAFFLFAVCLFVGATSVRARLGESEDDLKARYGDPTNPGDKADNRVLKRIYEYKGITITVMFLNGKSACEEYDGVTNMDAVAAILQANAGKFNWKADGFARMDATDQSLVPNKWTLCSPAKTSPVKSFATASYEGTTLTIATFEFLDFMISQQNAGTLKGF